MLPALQLLSDALHAAGISTAEPAGVATPVSEEVYAMLAPFRHGRDAGPR